LALCLCLTFAADERPWVVIVVGAPGTSEYGSQFQRWCDQWAEAARKASAETIRIGSCDAKGTTDRDRLRSALAAKSAPSHEALWVVLIGHGTYDGREAK